MENYIVTNNKDSKQIIKKDFKIKICCFMLYFTKYIVGNNSIIEKEIENL